LPDAYFADLKTALEQRRDFLASGLQAIGFDVQRAPATYFAMASFERLEMGGDDLGFCRRMTAEAGVTAIPLSAFYSQGGRSSFIRFCFAKTPATLAEAVSRLEGWEAVLAAPRDRGRL
jgi:aspartate/methionine/tyrosine aminotransferase